ncbi:uncharacterized protein F5147DRAFT_696699 [Suillus discolor]|uniref:LIM zinc-binding domain-containing protein n=1 Tax=Suillus discolor TaxID=1912936 RepID=A0A9P7JTC2_9AGAM|nr:uncharacterized protein F5147DRAFT_696699 [Suillus discolor]KAG2107687.1 hypothetical protein F5147DRAFT_696699 [Suillus discolor]
MHPFGGTPICPRCNKAVYAAEQVMGPGRKLYHKPCLACTTCNKRLDSLTLLEHDQEPYCKTCHVRNFGTRDLRHANLPHRNDMATPPPLPASPVRNSFPAPTFIRGESVDLSQRQDARSPVRAQNSSTGRYTNGAMSPSPILKANSVLPARFNRSPNNPIVELSSENTNQTVNTILHHEGVREETPVESALTFTGTVTSTVRIGDMPRTVPLSPTKSASNGTNTTSTPKLSSVTLARSSSSPMTPLQQTSTGTRYGVAFGSGGTPVKAFSAGTTPTCPRCGKNVYFAEQMKAIGKTWHKGCLRCKECNTPLDSTRLTEKDGDPLCHRCYSKLHGPAGNGYALLGKAGG